MLTRSIGMHKCNMVYVLNFKDPALLLQILYQGFNQGPSDPEAVDIPMSHCASLFLKKSVSCSISYVNRDPTCVQLFEYFKAINKLLYAGLIA